MANKNEVTTSSVRGEPVPQDVLDEMSGKAEPEHLVTLEVEGQKGQGIYLTKDFQPTTVDKADALKVTFEDGRVVFYVRHHESKSQESVQKD